MEEELPTEFDLVVIGTGLSESIVAAAASRVGKTVLHLDTNDYYGGFWASFNLDSFRKYLNSCDGNEQSVTTENKIENNFLQLCANPTNVHNGHEKWNSLVEHGDVDGWTREKIMQEFRRFNIDLTPKLLYARGSMVELLISSNICRYAEFRALDRVATVWEGKVMTVPCSRSDVFTSKDVNVIEKRLLMKFLQSCATYDEGSDIETRPEELNGKTFLEHLKNYKLTPNLIHYVLYTIAMGNDRTPARDGLAGVKKFLMSLGHYGNSPFLFPIYGCGEIPQCFCRLCAVFGGIYCLNRAVEGIRFETQPTLGGLRYESVKCGKQNIKSKDLVVGHGYLSRDIFVKGSTLEDARENSCGKLARAVILTNVPFGGPSQNSGCGGVAIMKLPPVNHQREGATILQMSHPSGTCPKDIYLIHVTTLAVTENPKEDLKPYIASILSYDYSETAKATTVEGSTKEENIVSTILYEAYFNIPACIVCTAPQNMSVPAGVRITCGPHHELDYDRSIEQAKSIFMDIYPDEDFLPRAPDPEEIIIGEEEPVQEQAGDAGESNDEPVDNASECRDTESDSALAQEAKEEAVDKAEECVEQK